MLSFLIYSAMDLIERYPKLNKCLVKQYGNSYQVTQPCLDTLICFVNALYESELESQRKEVNPYEEVKEDTYLGRNKRHASKHTSRNEKKSSKRSY
jgi:hypothetical protein